MEEEWKEFRDPVLKFVTEVCGCRLVRQGLRKRVSGGMRRYCKECCITEEKGFRALTTAKIRGSV